MGEITENGSVPLLSGTNNVFIMGLIQETLNPVMCPVPQSLAQTQCNTTVSPVQCYISYAKTKSAPWRAERKGVTHLLIFPISLILTKSQELI